MPQAPATTNSPEEGSGSILPAPSEKVAGGMWNTHSKCGDCRMELLAAHAASLGLRSEKVSELLSCVMCDDALRILLEEQLYDAVLARLAGRIEFHLQHKCGEMEIGAMVFSKEYGRL